MGVGIAVALFARGRNGVKLDAKVKKRAGAFQLDCAIQAEAGAIVLWGASGAGKTMTLNCLAGFSRPDSGRILAGDELFYDGATGVHVPPQRRRCGYIFQDHALFPHMTVMENLSFAAGASKQRSKQRIKDVLEAFELRELAQRRPAQLSGGQQQRAALARVLVTEPRLLLLDEPTQGLDARLKRGFFELLRQMRERSDALLVLVTHDLDECFEMGEYVCLLENGKIIQAGRKEAVFAKPASVEVARSLGIYNVIPAEIEMLDPGKNVSRLRMLGASWNGLYFPGHLLGDKGTAVFRETAVKLSRGAGDARLLVEAVKPYARGVRLQLEEGMSALVSESEAREVRAGSTVAIQIAAGDIVFLSK